MRVLEQIPTWIQFNIYHSKFNIALPFSLVLSFGAAKESKSLSALR
jgi:hypothetical protein